MKLDFIHKYIRKETSLKQAKEVLDWIELNDLNANTYNSIKSKSVFENLPYKPAKKAILKRIIKKNRPLENNLKWENYLIKAAAILLLPLSIFSVYQYISYKSKLNANNIISEQVVIPEQNGTKLTYTVHPGVKGMIDLPDGSKVWLNSASKLICPEKFDSTARVVELSGEGYFKVVSNKQWPMFVRTSKGVTVKVTGTEFNLSSYENDKEFKFTLVEGKVTLVMEKTKQYLEVNTLEEIIIPDNIKEKGLKKNADIDLNTAWKEGNLVFDDTPMEDVVKKLERWYGVKINVNSKNILKYNFTAYFRSESITQVLDLLKITSNITYSIKGNTVSLYLE